MTLMMFISKVAASEGAGHISISADPYGTTGGWLFLQLLRAVWMSLQFCLQQTILSLGL